MVTLHAILFSKSGILFLSVLVLGLNHPSSLFNDGPPPPVGRDRAAPSRTSSFEQTAREKRGEPDWLLFLSAYAATAAAGIVFIYS